MNTYLDVAIALGQRFSGISIEQRRLGETNWPMPVRVRLVTAKRARQAYAEPVYGMTVEEACRALVHRVAELDCAPAEESEVDRLRRLVREYTALVEACHEPPYDGNRDELAKAYCALLAEAR